MITTQQAVAVAYNGVVQLPTGLTSDAEFTHVTSAFFTGCFTPLLVSPIRDFALSSTQFD